MTRALSGLTTSRTRTHPARPLAESWRTPRALPWLSLSLLALLALPGSLRAEDKPLDPKLRVELIKALRSYLQLDVDPYAGREATRSVLTKIETGGGPKVLARMDLLRELTDQGRDFEKDYRDRKWQKLEANTEVSDGKYAVSVSRPDKLRLAFSAPKGYAEAALAKLPRVDPFPTLVTLIEEKDYSGKKFPGEEAIARRYSAFKELFEKWLVLAPVAVRGNYVDDGNVRQLFYTAQLKDFYQRFHLDFERIVLDGDTSNATTIVAAQPFMYAGLVVRRPLTGEPVVDPDTVVNYAHVPIYVMGCPVTEKALKDAGHPSVTLGDEAGLMAWLGQRKRVIPKTFSWRLKTAQQVFANWLILTPDWNVEKRTVDVTVLDTAEDPNTIRIQATGVLDLTALLNDDLVALDKDVRMVVNGKELFKGKLERTLERLYDKDPVEAREAIFFSLLFTTITKQFFAPPPAAAPSTPTPGPAVVADPEKEAKARSWLEKAEGFVTDGNTEKAVQILERLVSELGETSVAVTASARLAELKAAPVK